MEREVLTCIGGPLEGQRRASRFPKGFLLVNRLASQVAIYDRAKAEALGYDVWFVREVNGNWKLPEIDDPSAEKNRYRAALEPNYDVVAYDPEEMPPWDR